jgi:hypothetical protein
MQAVTRKAIARHAAILIGFALVTLAMMWPLPRHLDDHVIGARYYWDAYTNTMLMGARTNGALGRDSLSVYDSYFMAPIPHTIAFNENLFGLSLIFAPLYLATDAPLLAYNITLLLSLTLSGYFMFLLVRRLTGSSLAGLVAGVAFPFCPYAFFEMGRIQLVATQWIPLFFLFLLRAAEEKRTRDVVGMGVAYALQVGTCLYYAMFMLPLAVLAGAVLLWQHWPFPRRFWLALLGTGAGVVGAAAAMIWPYFDVRERFKLIRSKDFAENFDGRLEFLAHVAPTNKSLPFLHHMPASPKGAPEEIAFPGFTIAALVAIGLVWSLARGLRAMPAGRALATLLRWLGVAVATLALAAATIYATRDAALGAVVVLLGALAWTRMSRGARLLPRRQALWCWFLLFALALYVGMTPLELPDGAVRGIYYYLHTYVPGWSGIRKVSRQAIMLAVGFSVLAGFGGALLLGAIRNAIARGVVTCVLVSLVLFEFRTAPSKVIEVPAGKTVSGAYRYIARQPGDKPVGVIPSRFGKKIFRGHRGMARHNYMALFHHRRTLNGKSSWIPDVTHTFHHATRALPGRSAVRIMQILDPQFLLILTDDMTRGRARRLLKGLDRREDVFRKVWENGHQYVYELIPSDDPTLKLLPTPELDRENLVAIDKGSVKMTSLRGKRQVENALDGDPETRWATFGSQMPGDFVAFELSEPAELAGFEFTDPRETWDCPLAFDVDVSLDARDWQRVYRRERLQAYHDQVYDQAHFHFVFTFSKPTLAKYVRVTLREGVPGRWWTIREAQLWKYP